MPFASMDMPLYAIQTSGEELDTTSMTKHLSAAAAATAALHNHTALHNW